MKQLSEAESDVVIKNYVSAHKKLIEILNEDIYNYRALELYCDVNYQLGTSEEVFNFLISKKISYSQFRSSTLILISEILSQVKNSKAEKFSKDLLDIASSRKLEETQLVKVAFTLRKLGEEKEVVDFVNNAINSYPNLAANAILLDVKGRALIDLAKICEKTYFESKSIRIKNKAQEDFEKYITDAQKTLALAYQNSENNVDKDYIEKALHYVKTEMLPFLSSRRNAPTESRTIFISNIPREIDKTQLESHFVKYGKIRRIKLNENLTRDKQYAFIEFEQIESSKSAYTDRFSIYINNHKLILRRHHRNFQSNRNGGRTRNY